MLAGFTAGLLLITVSELGDKTFFIAALLAMRHPRRLVFIGVSAALAAMTIISVLFGQVATLLPQQSVRWAEVILFLGFGLKLLFDARQASDQPNTDEVNEAMEVVKQAETKLPKRYPALGIILEAFGLTFVAEWGDRTQFATIALAAANPPVGVTLGAILGHLICAAIAVACGRMICGRISERVIALMGGSLFLLFAAIGMIRLLWV